MATRASQSWKDALMSILGIYWLHFHILSLGHQLFCDYFQQSIMIVVEPHFDSLAIHVSHMVISIHSPCKRNHYLLLRGKKYQVTCLVVPGLNGDSTGESRETVPLPSLACQLEYWQKWRISVMQEKANFYAPKKCSWCDFSIQIPPD